LLEDLGADSPWKAQEASMADIPADAPRSEDGQWWWDGTQWQPVQDAGATSSSSAAGATSAPAEGTSSAAGSTPTGEVNASGVPYTASGEIAEGTALDSIDMSVDTIAGVLEAAGIDIGSGGGDLVAQNPTEANA
jgi:hypothetical protein